MNPKYERDNISDLEEYQDCYLIKSLKNRGYEVFSDVTPIIERIYFLRRCNQDYQKELELLIEKVIGRY